MKSKYLRLKVPEGEGSEVIEYENKEPDYGYIFKKNRSIRYKSYETYDILYW